MPSPSEYLAVLKASYDYEPQSEDEIAIKEDQVLLLVERVDEDWWKVKIKDASDEEVGLVPAAYVEKADHKSVVKAVYDYDASAPGELSMKEDEVLYVYDKDEDWLLVQSGNDDGKVGFVPGTYVEETEGGGEASAAAEEEEEEAPSQASQIVIPPSPPRPTSVYVDPADRVAQSVPSVQADSIQTWAVSEVDKKGKKKKGTLGIGNGAIFFASESDKTPVQKWQTADIESSRIDKSKHVHIEVGGASATSLHFNAGSKDTAEAIIEKLESSKRAASSSSQPARSTPSPPAEGASSDSKPKKNGISVHFASAPPSIISPREPSSAEGEEEYEHVEAEAEDEDDGMLRVTALYDFAADGEDELSISEGERLILLERDGDEWWKVRNTHGGEGVVPAQYVELDQGASAILDEADSFSSRAAEDAAKAAREAEEKEAQKREREAAAERQRETDRKRAESERRARAAKAAADAAEADRKRKEREQKEKEEEEEEERQREAEAEKERKRSASAVRTPRTSSATTSKPPRSDSKASDDKASSPSKSRAEGKTRPSPQRTRVWHDITGQFSVEAEFLAYANGKLRLHKVNGVVIEVPAAKMSPEDLKYVDRVTGKGKRQSSPGPPPGALSDDDEPLAVRRRSLQPEPKQPPKSASPPKKGPPIDWFEFFLSAGCELDDCTRYASSFERDKMDASLLPDITEQTMRSLGLREGDIIRVTKAIAQRTGSSSKKEDSAVRQQMQRDEELAKQLQAEENGGSALPRRQTTSSPAPNLFAGPGGQLKNNTRRGRPQASKSTPPSAVDLNSITTASEHINRVGSPTAVLTTSPTSVQAPARPMSAAPAPAPVVSGFDDDAWTNRPSSTKPIIPTPPAVQPRAPSAPPAQTTAPPAPAPPPVPPVPAAATTPAPAPAIATTASAPASIPSSTSPTSPGNSLARTTTSDVFDQLARLSILKSQSPANQPVAVSPITTVSPPPVGFQQGLGMGSSPVPMGQVQIQPTGFVPNNNAPRGPFAPVPQNQGLLQPLVPTTTGFNGFLPTRPASTPMSFQATGYQPSPQPNAFQPPQQPSFLPTPNNFGGPIAAQPTGFPNSGPLLSQPTGFASSPFGGGVSYNAALNRPVGSLQQPAMTGFNPNFNQMSPPPPVPPLPPSLNGNNNVNSTAPANVFAQMKAGTFGKDDAPQPSVKYDALRPQPTGWGTFQNGFSGQYY